MIKKVLKSLLLFLSLFGIIFSNIPFYAASSALNAYVKSYNIVDKAWHLQKDSNVVDEFASFRNLTEELKIKETYAATSGQVYPTLGVTVAESPWLDNNWTNPTNVYSDDAATAYVIAASFDSPDQTYVLKATGFDFSAIPDGSTINGVTARVNAWYRTSTGAGAMDLCQLLDINKAKVGTNQCATQVALTTNNTTIITKGSASDKWGNALDTAWIKDPDFGIAIGIKATAANADVDVDYVTLEIDYTPPADSTAPTPNPMTFATAPNNTSATQIDMMATTATDATTPPVSYYFALDTTACIAANIGTGAADSAWQSGTTYSDIGLGVNKCYGYKVKARDSVATPNETGYSGITTLYTSANTPSAPTVGSPTETTLVITNNENGNPLSNPVTYFAVQVTTADANWNGKWVNASGASSATAVWLTDAQLTNLTVTGLTGSTLYDFNVKARNEDLDETGLSTAGSGTTSAPAAVVTASYTGTLTSPLDSGATAQYLGAAFRFQQNTGSAVNITGLTLTDAGTITFNNTGSSEVSNVSLSYKTGDSGTCATGGETTVGNGTLNASDSVTWSAISIPASVSTNYTCVYIRLDLTGTGGPANGGDTLDLKINASGDFTVNGGATTAGTADPTGTNTIRPVFDSTTAYTNSTESGLNWSSGCTACGARIGPRSSSKEQTLVINGKGFGADPGSGSRDGPNNKVEIVGASTIVLGDDGGVESNVTAWSNTSITIRTNTEVTGTPANADTDWGTNFGGAAALKVTAGGQTVPTNLNFYVFPQITSLTTNVSGGAREYSASDIDGVIRLNGTRFGTAPTGGYARIFGCDSSTCSSPTGSVTFVADIDCDATDGWANTCIKAQVPTVIGDGTSLGDVSMQQGTGSNNKTHATAANFLRILPRIISTAPVDAKGGQSQAITVTGNHFCQDASCADYATDSDDATFNAVSAKASYTAVSDTSISLSVPATATDGNLVVTSDSASGGTTYTSNGYSYNVKFGPSTPTGSSGSGNNNPTLNNSVSFSDGTDGDSFYSIKWEIAHNSDGDWSTPEWTRTSLANEASIDVNNTNGTFQNGDNGQPALDCGTTYKGRIRYMDNGNGGAGTYAWEYSWSGNYTFTTAACNAAPTISISQPPSGNVTVNQGDLYNITYTLSDTDDVITANFYYDANGSGLDGTAITGCQNKAEGTNATCAWNTTGYPLGTYYVYGTTTDGVNPEQNAYSAGTITIQAPPQVTASSTGTQTVNLDSGAGGQYIGAAFTFQQTSGTADTITALTISETGSVNANANLSANAGVRYETGVAGCTYNGNETLISGTFNASDKMALSSISIPVTVGANYTCVYVVFDVSSSAVGGQTIDLEIASTTDFTLQNSTAKSGTYPAQLTGATTIRPKITGYDNITETNSAFDWTSGCTACGARIGNGSGFRQTIVISGYGFGADPGTGSRDTATSSIMIGTKTISDGGAGDQNVTAWSNTSITITTDTAVTGDDDASWGANFGGAAALKITAGGQAVATSSEFYIFPQITSLSTYTGVGNGAREYSASDIDGVIRLNGTRFGTAPTGGYARIFGCDSSTCSSPTGSVTFVADIDCDATDGWANTCIKVQVPTVIADNAYTDAVDMQQGTGANSKTHSFSTLRVLPRIISFSPGSAPVGDSVVIIGNHFCQAGAASCPIAGSRSTASDKAVFFNSVQTPDGDVTAWGNGDSSTSGITVNVPTGATTGNVAVTSDSRASNSASFTVTSITATAPGNLKQARDSGFTNLIAEGGVATSSTVYFSATSTASTGGGTMYLQIEMRPINNAFSGTCAGNPYCFDGPPAGVSYPTANASITATTSTTTVDAFYHWQTRARYNRSSTDYFSSWTTYGTNSDPDGIDFKIDTTAPVISGISYGTPSTNGATITWNTTGDLSTSQVEYSTSSDMTPSTLTALTNTPPETNGTAAHSVTLSNLNCGTTYYFKVKSKDSGNLESTSSTQNFPTGACPTNPAKTATFYIVGKTTTVTNGSPLSQTFAVNRPETIATTTSAFVEITGVYDKTSSASNGIDVQVDSQGIKTYAISPIVAKSHFSIIYRISPVNTSHTLSVTPPSDTTLYISSAKLIVTYSYTP